MKSHKDPKTNSLEPTTIESHSTTTQGSGPGTSPNAPNISHGVAQRPQALRAHEDEKIALVLSLTGIFTIWYMFQ